MAAAPAATKPPKRRHVGPYELTRVLGQGSFGKVRLGVQIFTGEKVQSLSHCTSMCDSMR